MTSCFSVELYYNLKSRLKSVNIRFVGDVNSEIHCLSRNMPLCQDSFRFTLETGHSYVSTYVSQRSLKRFYNQETRVFLVLIISAVV